MVTFIFLNGKFKTYCRIPITYIEVLSRSAEDIDARPTAPAAELSIVHAAITVPLRNCGIVSITTPGA